MVGGSNFGELLGAGFVFLFTNLVITPMPWLRLDALMLLIVWYLAYWSPPRRRVSQAWIVSATLLPISFGWATGDVSLAAYIQASRVRTRNPITRTSQLWLGAVIAFLCSTYIIIYAISQPLLGKYIDRVFTATGGPSHGGSVSGAIRNVAGVQFTVISVTVFAASFIPRGALGFNPNALYGESLDKNIEDDDSSVGDSVKPSSLDKEKDFVNAAELTQPGGRSPIVGTVEPMK